MMPEMRTTLTLEDDLAGLVERRARELGISFKEAVSRTIRAGLGEATRPDAIPRRRRFPTRSALGRVSISTNSGSSRMSWRRRLSQKNP